MTTLERDGVSSAFYDAGRGALLLYMYAPSPQILRYSYSGATGWTSSPLVVAFPGAGAMSASADGAKIFVGFQDPTPLSTDLGVWEVDPVALTVLKTTKETLMPVLAAPVSMSVANDGLTIMTFAQNNPMTYSELRPELNLLVPNPSALGGLTASSLDGSIVVMTGGGPDATGGAEWNASNEQLTIANFGQQSQPPSVNRDGTRTVVLAVVYDANFAVLGNLPATTAASILAPSAAKAYTWDTNGITGTVRTFDISAAPVAGQFPEVGTGVTPPGTYVGQFARMAISPDGGTLFLAGQNNIAVMPAP